MVNKKTSLFEEKVKKQIDIKKELEIVPFFAKLYADKDYFFVHFLCERNGVGCATFLAG